MTLKDIRKCLNDLKSVVNVHNGLYDALSAMVGDGPIDTITESQIDVYFNGALSAEMITAIKNGLGAMEHAMPQITEDMLSVDASILKDIEKLTG